jgi:hypothetical protein
MAHTNNSLINDRANRSNPPKDWEESQCSGSSPVKSASRNLAFGGRPVSANAFLSTWRNCPNGKPAVALQSNYSSHEFIWRTIFVSSHVMTNQIRCGENHVSFACQSNFGTSQRNLFAVDGHDHRIHGAKGAMVPAPRSIHWVRFAEPQELVN